MGCFSFGAKRKVPENRTPENSAAMMKVRVGTPGGDSGPSAAGSVSSSNGAAQTPPGKNPYGPITSGAFEIYEKYGGHALPLPAPLPDSRSAKSNLNKVQPSKSDEKLGIHQQAEVNRLPSSAIGASGVLRNGPDWGGGWYTGGGEKASSKVGGNSRKLEMQTSAFGNGKKHGGLIPFTLKELEIMTMDFSVDGYLGEGGFGAVHKGVMVDPATGNKQLIAVKVLDIDGNQGELEWLTEVVFLGHLHHPNLVRLLGYCAEGKQRMLVYEYMAKGSLEFALFRRSPRDTTLSWNLRMKIALGAARGLAYLHEEADHQVIYRDFKTSNVLLDKSYEAKVSDFGLARSGPEGDASHVSTRVVGTAGYAAPEYVMTGHLTIKSDIWGFGVVLLEILTGKVAMDKTRPKDEHYLVEWAAPYLENPSTLYKIMDPDLGGRYSVRGAQAAAALIQKCLNKKPKQRPTMTEVVQALEPLQDLRDMAGFTADELRSSSRKVSAPAKKAASTNITSPTAAEAGQSTSSARKSQSSSP